MKSAFTENLKYIRENNEISQKQMAQILSVTEQEYADIEHGDCPKNDENFLEILATFFKVDPEYFNSASGEISSYIVCGCTDEAPSENDLHEMKQFSHYLRHRK